ncbi:hypothetical protein M569_14837 [Genlisea aurea]|uniref:Pentacotripeptide-repeat region of PRORP domain-containing protein n=1 Tax=Genlisea aurea TaxID=192259 RepID=S8DB85_9LAMI|nr:hypothetical protein M569_14837 [Genlisea aurea]
MGTDGSTQNAVIEALHRTTSWKFLSENFSSVEFSEPLFRSVMLQLKEPMNSRKALNFFHWAAKELHFEHGVSSYCIMIHILAKARMIKDAKALLESILNKKTSSGGGGGGEPTEVIVLNELINGFTAADSIPFVFDLFIQTCAKLRMLDYVSVSCKQLLDDRGFSLSVISFNTVLHVMEKSGRFDSVWLVYEQMIRSRTCPNEATVRTMVNALCKAGKLESFLRLVDKMNGRRCSSPRVIANAYLIHGMIGDDRIREGLSLLKWMLQKNFVFDTISCCLVVFAKVKTGEFAAAREIYRQLIDRGFAENAFACSLFVEFCSETGRIRDAVAVLAEMEKAGLTPTDEAMSRLVWGCASSGRLDDGLLHCRKMAEEMRLLPSRAAVNEMFRKLGEAGRTGEADEMLTVLLEKGFEPDRNTYSHLVSGYGKEGATDRVIRIQYEMKHRLDLNEIV